MKGPTREVYKSTAPKVQNSMACGNAAGKRHQTNRAPTVRNYFAPLVLNCVPYVSRGDAPGYRIAAPLVLNRSPAFPRAMPDVVNRRPSVFGSLCWCSASVKMIPYKSFCVKHCKK
jgi:hypothetical protein